MMQDTSAPPSNTAYGASANFSNKNPYSAWPIGWAHIVRPIRQEFSLSQRK